MGKLYKAITILALVLFPLYVWGANPKAKRVRTDTTNFDAILSVTDTDVQKSLDTLDNINIEVIPTSLTAGSVVFSDGTTLAEDNPGLTYIPGTGLSLDDNISIIGTATWSGGNSGNANTAYTHSQVSGGIHEDWTNGSSSANFLTSGQGDFGIYNPYAAILGDNTNNYAGYFYVSGGDFVAILDGNNNVGINVDTSGSGNDSISVGASSEFVIDSTGNITAIGNITGTDIDISAGTGDYISSGNIYVDSDSSVLGFGLNSPTTPDATIGFDGTNLLYTSAFNRFDGVITLNQEYDGLGGFNPDLLLNGGISIVRPTDTTFAYLLSAFDVAKNLLGYIRVEPDGQMTINSQNDPVLIQGTVAGVDAVDTTAKFYVLSNLGNAGDAGFKVKSTFGSLTNLEGSAIRHYGGVWNGLVGIQGNNALASALYTDGNVRMANGDVQILTDNKKLQLGATATDLEIYSDGTNGIIDVLTELRLGNDVTNYISISPTGDVVFVGSSGLAFGEIYVSGNAVETVISASGKANKVQFTLFDTDGESNNTTPDNTTDDITITKAGKYILTVSMHVDSPTGGGSYKLGMSVWKNNGATEFPNTIAHRDLASGSSETGSMVITGILDLAVDDTIELWVWNETDTTNAIFRGVTMNLMQIGG